MEYPTLRFVFDRKKVASKDKKGLVQIEKVPKEFGKINYFHDLTKANITLLDEFLRGRGIKNTTLYNFHKFNKVYINETIRFGLLAESPYMGFKVNRGKSDKRKYLTAEEMALLKECDIPDEKVGKVRDLFLFQCYTGLSYSDMYKFDFERDVIEKEGKYVIFDRRQKTNEDYYIVLLSPAMDILRRYNFRLPLLSNQRYNNYIKVAASYAHIGKELSSHAARHIISSYSLKTRNLQRLSV